MLLGVVKSYFEKNTVSLIMFPTVKLTAIPIDSMSSRDTLKIFSNTILGIISNQHPFTHLYYEGSLIGFPSISIPIGKTMDTSLPVGIEIMARKGDDKYELIINA